MNDWENATMEQKIDELRRDMLAQFHAVDATFFLVKRSSCTNKIR